MKNQKLEINYSIATLSELNTKEQALIAKAKQMRENSYSPYSKFSVGAAVLCEDDEIIGGANQENSAYPSGICAERAAIFAAGSQKKNIISLAIAAKNQDNKQSTAFPCGACRQVILECEKLQTKKPITIFIVLQNNDIMIFDGIDCLLPFSFEL